MMKMNTSCNDDGKLVPYSAFTNATPALPAFYWDVYSSEQRIKAICLELNKLIEYADMLNVNLNATHDDVVKLEQELENLKNGGLLEYYEKQIYKWIQENMESIMQKALLQFVTLGINDDGYLVLYRPDSWNDIMFDWGAVYGRSDYGRIILRMDVGNSGIDNTYSYSLAQTTTIKQLIADLETNAKRTDAAYDTLFTNLNQEVNQPAGFNQIL